MLSIWWWRWWWWWWWWWWSPLYFYCFLRSRVDPLLCEWNDCKACWRAHDDPVYLYFVSNKLLFKLNNSRHFTRFLVLFDFKTEKKREEKRRLTCCTQQTMSWRHAKGQAVWQAKVPITSRANCLPLFYSSMLRASQHCSSLSSSSLTTGKMKRSKKACFLCISIVERTSIVEQNQHTREVISARNT